MRTGSAKQKTRPTMPRGYLGDESVHTPGGVFAIVDGRPVAFTFFPLTDPATICYAKAERELLRQCINRMDHWIRLAEELKR